MSHRKQDNSERKMIKGLDNWSKKKYFSGRSIAIMALNMCECFCYKENNRLFKLIIGY